MNTDDGYIFIVDGLALIDTPKSRTHAAYLDEAGGCATKCGKKYESYQPCKDKPMCGVCIRQIIGLLKDQSQPAVLAELVMSFDGEREIDLEIVRSGVARSEREGLAKARRWIMEAIDSAHRRRRLPRRVMVKALPPLVFGMAEALNGYAKAYGAISTQTRPRVLLNAVRSTDLIIFMY